MAQIGVLPPRLKRGDRLQSRMWEGNKYPYPSIQVRPVISVIGLEDLHIEDLKFGG